MRVLKIGLLAFTCVITLSGCNKKKASSAFGSELQYFYETFTGSDGSALSTDWDVYTDFGLDIQISGNKARLLSGGTTASVWATYQTALPSSAYTVSTTYTISGGDLSSGNSPTLAILAGMDNPEITSVTEYFICGFYGSDTAVLYSQTGTLASDSTTHFALTNGSTINVSFENDGAGGLTCTVTDGTELVTLTHTQTTPNSGTYVGFGGSNGISTPNYTYADDFLATWLE